MMKLYYHPPPHPAKVALFLEEARLGYELVPIDTRKGEQHLPTFTAINPNAKTPALVVDGDAVVFDSNAILLYLAEKTGQFLPENTPAACAVPFVLGAEAWQEVANVKRLLDEVNAHPAAQRAEALKAKHAYKAEMDDDAKQAMFPQNVRIASSQGAA